MEFRWVVQPLRVLSWDLRVIGTPPAEGGGRVTHTPVVHTPGRVFVHLQRKLADWLFFLLVFRF